MACKEDNMVSEPGAENVLATHQELSPKKWHTVKNPYTVSTKTGNKNHRPVINFSDPSCPMKGVIVILEETAIIRLVMYHHRMDLTKTF